MTSPASLPKSNPSVPAIVQATKVLRCLSTSENGLSVTAVARKTGISQSSCFNILRTLLSENLVSFEVDSKLYTVGFGLVQLVSPMLGRSRPAMIRPELTNIAQIYGALIALWEISDDEKMVLVDRVFVDTAVRIEMRAGQRVPSFAGAVGRSVAAARQLKPDQLRTRFEKLIWHSPISFKEYAESVERARVDGYAIDSEQYFRGICVVGTAVVDESGRPRMGIGALTLAKQLSEAQLKDLGRTLHATAVMAGRIWFPADQETPGKDAFAAAHGSPNQ